MKNYREFTINEAINNMVVFVTGRELLDFVIFDVLLVGNYHVGRNDVKRIVDPNLLSSGTGTFDILLVDNQRGNMVITVYRDNNDLFRITDVTVEEEPSRRPLYAFPVDSPESIQITIDDNKLRIWSANNNANIEMKISDIFIEGKHWESGHHFIPVMKINKDEVLDYFLDFMGVSIDQASYSLIKHDIIRIINTDGEPIRLSIRDKRTCARVANPATIAKQMILVNDGSSSTTSIMYNLSEETFFQKDYNSSIADIAMDLKFIAMSIRYDDENNTLFSCATGTQNNGTEECYYIDNVQVALTEHKPPRHDIYLSKYQYGKMMRELASK